jgi:hypothetical protein
MSINLFEETSNFRIVSESEYKVLRIKVSRSSANWANPTARKRI